MKIDEIKKLFCSYEIDDAVENPWKYSLAVLVAMRKQMLEHEKYLLKEHIFYSEELKSVAHAAMQAEIISDHLREHRKQIKNMNKNIFKEKRNGKK